MTPVTTCLAIKSVELPGRARLAYAEQGDPLGIPVLLLHGATDSWRSFERVLPHLPDSIRAIAVTQRGHGESSRPEGGYPVTLRLISSPSWMRWTWKQQSLQVTVWEAQLPSASRWTIPNEPRG